MIDYGVGTLRRLHEVEAERDRYREALESIRDHGETPELPCHAVFAGDCADVMRETASAALSRKAD